ncbi:MAG: T9SS type A sorting domain-containing protein, partial [Bacteroidota bacterium]
GASNAVPDHTDNSLKYFDEAVLQDIPNDNLNRVPNLNEFDLGFYFSGKTDAANASGAGAALSAHEDGILCQDGGNGQANDNMVGGVLAPLKAGAGAGAGAANFTMQAWIDVVAHEMGHAFGASHTWSSNNGSCSPGQFDNLQSYEIGSGSTLMSYLGICDDNDGTGIDDNIVVASTENNAYFHTGSIYHIFRYLSNVNSPTDCVEAETVVSNPNAPVITFPNNCEGSTINIPPNTPFALDASATDADSDALTYNWEQSDLAAAAFDFEGATPSGPLVRSRQPVTQTIRYIPQLSDLAAGSFDYEPLPNTNRTMDWQFTVRDQKGGVVTKGLTITVTNSVTALSVSSQNAPTTTMGGETETINWTAGGGGCGTVDILLSTEGGATFPTTLASGTANDGTEDVTMPLNTGTTQARVMVRCVSDCVKSFNINSSNFTITNVVPVELLSFTGKAVEDKAILEWETASEQDNKGFQVEHSTTGNTFQTIGFVEGNGTTVERQAYRFSHQKINTAVNYYRLKQLDFDGGFEYSAVVAVIFGKDAEDVLRVFPNPTQDQLNIAFASEQAATIEIFDQLSRRVKTIVTKNAQNQIDVSDLATGLYWLKVQTNRQLYTLPVVLGK